VCGVSRGTYVVAGCSTRWSPREGRREELCAVCLDDWRRHRIARRGGHRFPGEGRREAPGAGSLEVLTSSQGRTAKRFPSELGKRSTVGSRSRGTNVVAGWHDEAVSSGREERSTGCGLSRGVDVVAGWYDEAGSPAREMRSTVSCLSRGSNVVAGWHNTVPLEDWKREAAPYAVSLGGLTVSQGALGGGGTEERELKHCVLSISRY
jgi:hypothetical protein